MKHNQKGQTLVFFILLLPVLLLLLGFLVDMGTLYLEKRKLDRTIENTVEYGMIHLAEEDLEQTLTKQLNYNGNIQIVKIEITDETVTITAKREVKFIFGFLTGRNKETIEITYHGSIVEQEIRIVRG